MLGRGYPCYFCITRVEKPRFRRVIYFCGPRKYPFLFSLSLRSTRHPYFANRIFQHLTRPLQYVHHLQERPYRGDANGAGRNARIISVLLSGPIIIVLLIVDRVPRAIVQFPVLCLAR